MAAPTAPRKRTPANRTPAKPTGTFARLRAEATKGENVVEPYLIEDVVPPIAIHPPATLEQQLELSELYGDGDFQLKDARRILQLVCGDSFDQVWELMRGEHINVLAAFIADLGRHFGAVLQEGADFPGGSEASST